MIHSTTFVSDSAIELFWWAVFNNRLNLSKFLWKLSQDQLSLALIAVALCNSCKDLIPASETATLQQFTKMQEIYEQFAIDLLNEGNK